MRFSLLTIILLTAYAAICSTVFVYANLWFGTLVVVATAALFGAATVKGFRAPSRFLCSFSVVGWSWLVFWLGFYAQTDKAAENWSFPRTIYAASEPIRHTALDAGSGEAKFHSLHVMAQLRQHTTAPAFHNLLRLVVCISGLLVGGSAGMIHELIGSMQLKYKSAPCLATTSAFCEGFKMQSIENANLTGSSFRNVNLASATFDDVNLSSATIHNVNLSRARLDDVNLSHVEITNACIHEMRILGVLVSDLFAAYNERLPPASK